MKGLLARLCAIGMVSWLVGACALMEESVDIHPKLPRTALAQVPNGGGGGLVEVKGVDLRIQYRDRVGTKKNGYGVELAKIKSTKSVVEIVRGAIEQDLAAHGYTIGPGGSVVTVEILTFYSDFKPKFLVPVADSAAEVSFNLKVSGTAGQSVYDHTYRSTGKSSEVMLMTPGGARDALEHALSDALGEVNQDQALFSALTTNPQSTPPGPASPPPPASNDQWQSRFHL